MQAPGRWLSSPGTLARLGIEGEQVRGREFVALMEGRHPRSGEWLRRVGADGSRGGGIDLTFSAPKSVSITWALGDQEQRRQVEAAHAAAVQAAVDHLRKSVPAIRRRCGGQVVEQRAIDLIAAEYRHTTARGVVDGDAPDPQLHSHVVVSGALRDDGRIVAVASRPLFRAGRELGAYYRSALAHELAKRGYRIDAGTGKDGRYFEIAGVPRALIDAFSARSREVARAAERFRAQHGRAPEPDELRRIKLENRSQKIPVTQADLQDAWQQTAARHDFRAPRHERDRVPHDRAPSRQRERAREQAGQLRLSFEQPSTRDRTRQVELSDRVEARLTEQAATFTPSELRAVLLEQSVGQLPPDEAIEQAVKDWAALTEKLPVEQVALISDASNMEIDRINARAQHHRALRGELGNREMHIPGVHYGVRAGDRIILVEQHREQGRECFENGERGQVTGISQAGEVTVQFDITGRQATLAGEDLARLRLGYASHIHRTQGATVTRTIAITGGWQASKETAYVEASRARHGTDWYVSRADLGEDGHDLNRIGRLADAMRVSRAQTPSLAHAERPHQQREDHPLKLDLHIPPSRQPAGYDRHTPIAPSRRPLPRRGLRRLINRTPDLTIDR